MKRMFLVLTLASATAFSAFAIESNHASLKTPLGNLQENLEISSTEIATKCHCQKECHKDPIIKAYGSFYTEEGQSVIDVDPVTPGSSVILNQTSLSTNNVTLLAGGLIRISEPGDYFVNYGISVDLGLSTPPYEIALLLDGSFVPGSNISSNTSEKLFSGSVIIQVGFTPAILTIINFGGNDFTLSSPIPGDVTAFLTIKKVNRAPLPPLQPA